MRTYPSSWYPFALSAEVRREGVRKVRAFSTDWAVFRSASGEVGIVHATCAHMGADLTRGRVVGERLRCALHAWEYGRSGACEAIPGRTDIPAAARQPALPTTVSFGIVYGYLGEGIPPPLPAPEGFEATFLSRPFVATLALPYPMVGTNAFDTHHLLPLHHRRLDEAPQVTVVSEDCIRLRYRATVAGDGPYDRLIRRLGVGQVEVEVECFGGTQLVFYHRRLEAFTIFSSLIVDDDTTRVYLRTGRRRRWPAPLLRTLDQLVLEIHHRLILTFVFQDLDALRGMRFRPGALLPDEDRSFAAWYRHFRAIPRAPVPD
jgi:phenylpropionate dioxygenase-like ring-hydroxylating dioxygenase large terminal subunit